MTDTKHGELIFALAEARSRFIATFPLRCDEASAAIAAGSPEHASALQTLAHKTAGLAGMAGFHSVHSKSLELEALAAEPLPFPEFQEAAQRLVARMRQAFVKDLAAGVSRGRGKVLVAEDDDDQRAIVMGHLAEAGYQTLPVGTGTDVLSVARSASPVAIVLDVSLPGEDGFAVCRRLKADPELARIPVLFLTVRSRVDERLAALALGADEYLTKPADLRELVVRVDRACARSRRLEPGAPAEILSYEEFFEQGRAWLSRGPAAVVFVRLSPDHAEAGRAVLRRELRTRDLVGTYDSANVVLLMPELPASAARDRITAILSRIRAAGVPLVTAGIATSAAPGAALMDLMREAHEALIEARYLGIPAAVSGGDRPPARPGAATGLKVLLVDDDPDVARIIDAQMRAAGHTCTFAFDGEQALAALDRSQPDIVMLDLMLPKLGGFEVLTRMNQRETPPPPVVVLSARGREGDVTRAFELGASDYVTKPFSPQELMARVTRLVR